MLCLGLKYRLPAHCVHAGDGMLTGRIQNIFRPLNNLFLAPSFTPCSIMSADSAPKPSLGFHRADQLSSPTELFQADDFSALSSNGSCLLFEVQKLINISPFSHTPPTPPPHSLLSVVPGCCLFCFAFSHYSPFLCSALHRREANDVSVPTGFHLGSASGKHGWDFEGKEERRWQDFSLCSFSLGQHLQKWLHFFQLD